MAKMTRHDFGGILEALNKMIIAEVKTALELLPEKKMESGEGRVPLCHIVVSDPEEYQPYDLSVRRVWIDEDGDLCFSEYETRYNSSNQWTEYDDMLDITDFGYLINQIAGQVEGDKTYRLPNMSVLACGYVPELSLKAAMDKEVTV